VVEPCGTGGEGDLPPHQLEESVKEPSDPTLEIKGLLTDQMGRGTGLYVNLNQELIVTTEDKLRLCLNEHLGLMEQRREWYTPAGIFVALIATLSTASFHDFIVSKDTWSAIFIVAAVLCLLWLGRSLRRLYQSPSVEDVVGQLKKTYGVGPQGGNR